MTAVLALLLALSPAAAWEPAGEDAVARRIAEVDALQEKTALAYKKKAAAQKKAPGWTAKTAWTVGRYRLVVGRVTGIKNAALRFTACEDRARGEAVKATLAPETSPDGKTTVISGSRAVSVSFLDWHWDRAEKTLSCLAAERLP